MSHLKNTGFSDRISAAAEAKKAMLAKMKPKPTVTDPDFDKREELRAAELEAVRAPSVRNARPTPPPNSGCGRKRRPPNASSFAPWAATPRAPALTNGAT